MRRAVGFWMCVMVVATRIARGQDISDKDLQNPVEQDEPKKAAPQKSIGEESDASNATSNKSKADNVTVLKEVIQDTQVDNKVESPVIVDDTETNTTTTTTTEIVTPTPTEVNTVTTVTTGGVEESLTETPGTSYAPDSAETPTTIDRSSESVQVQPSAEEVSVDYIVDTEHGQVRGHKHGQSETILSYIDIPYGKFDSLFEGPQEPDSWDEIHDVTEHSKRCPQLQYPSTYVGETDCLTLSVFVPVQAENADVLFHIYDSNYVRGSADPVIYGPEYLVEKGVILVLPNYRVGPLGFLCLQNDIVPGNAALKDLMLALDWTKRNIGKFGGNAANIVVSGDGSSAALAEYLALSPHSNSHIAKVITESGSALAHWAIDRRPAETTEVLLNRLGANSDDILKNIEKEKLVIASINMTFRPCIEIGNNAFINATAWKLFTESEFNIPLMLGSAVYAGMHEALAHTPITLEDINEDHKLLLPDDLKFESNSEHDAVATRVKEQYFGNGCISTDKKENLVLWSTDMSYLGPGLRAARAWAAAGANVHFYEFSYVGELNREHSTLKNPLDGAARGDTVGYIFCQDQMRPEPASHEEHMMNVMTDLWVSFIQTGKPSADNVVWSAFNVTDESEEHWLAIGEDVISQRGMHAARLRLWTDVYRQHFVDGNSASAHNVVMLLPFTLMWIFFSSWHSDQLL